MCDVCHDFDLTKSHSDCVHWYWYTESIVGDDPEDLSEDNLSAYYWWRCFGWPIEYSEYMNTRSRAVVFQKIIEAEELTRLNDFMEYEEQFDWCEKIQTAKRKKGKFTRKNRKCKCIRT